MRTQTQEEILNYLPLHLNNWTYAESAIKRNFEFENFKNAFSFMTAIAEEAEKMNHHPTWTNAYNKVSISLSTHSAGGVTEHDLELASKIDQIYKEYEQL